MLRQEEELEISSQVSRHARTHAPQGVWRILSIDYNCSMIIIIEL